ncbi:hypothetical protein U1Q18_012756 [Sarracenia purpurea var. burkii]
MGFIGLFLLSFALFSLPSSIPTCSALNLSNVFLVSAPPGDESNYAFLTFVRPEKSGQKPHKKHHMMNCEKNPKPCKKHHSCCFKRVCVNLRSNPFNCGFCGRVCKHGMRCCKGVCVDIKNDRNHCGRCQNLCLPDESCDFGMCGYG